jgi:hypothetical protein
VIGFHKNDYVKVDDLQKSLEHIIKFVEWTGKTVEELEKRIETLEKRESKVINNYYTNPPAPIWAPNPVYPTWTCGDKTS